MERREEIAEASFAAVRERRRLGIAMAAIIRITETTTNNSIREKPVCLGRIAVNSSKLRAHDADSASSRSVNIKYIVHILRAERGVFFFPQGCTRFFRPRLHGAMFLVGLQACSGA